MIEERKGVKLYPNDRQFSSRLPRLASGSDDRSIKVWAIGPGQEWPAEWPLSIFPTICNNWQVKTQSFIMIIGHLFVADVGQYLIVCVACLVYCKLLLV